MTDLFIELRQTLRSLWRDRHFSGLAVLMLSVGIACTATIFSVVDAVLLRPLPLPDPERLVEVLERTPEGAEFTTSEPNFLDFQEQQRSFEALGAYLERAFDLLGQDQPERVVGAAASASFFAALQVAPQIGRTFSKDEDSPRADQRVVVVSDAFWRSKLNGDRTILGRPLVLNGTPHIVIGVMPPGFDFPSAALWVPLRADPASDRGNHWLTMIGRLSSGATLQSAERDLAAVAQRIGNAHPELRGWSVQVESLHNALLGTGLRAGLWTLMVAVTLFLLLTCANIANLFMTRVSARSEELAVRAALGAGKRRLVLHLLMEALVLAGVSGIITLLITVWSLDGVRTVAQERFPALAAVRFDLRLFAFTMLASICAALLFSLLPSLRAGGQELHMLLKAGVRGGARPQSQRTRELLLVTQVGLATVLLLGSGLVLRSLIALQRVDPGFAADSLLAVPLELTGQSYQREDWRQSVFFQQLEERVKQIPGVLAAGANTTDPFGSFHFVNGVTPVERAAEVGKASLIRADWRLVTRGYFDAARVPLLQGRLFGPEDRYDAPRVAVITKELAQRGLLAGSVLTLPLTGVVRVLLFQTAPLDPRTFLGVGFVLSAAALLAAYVPARRITHMDPLLALRSE